MAPPSLFPQPPMNGQPEDPAKALARQARWSVKVLRGLQALSDAAGATQDPRGDIARARAWIAARAATGRRKGKEALPTGGPHRQAVDLLVQIWEDEHGRKYPFAPRDAQAVRTLRGMADWDLGEASLRWTMLLRDEWWRRRGVSLPDLVNQWARLASAESRPAGSQATSAFERLARKLEGQ